MLSRETWLSSTDTFIKMGEVTINTDVVAWWGAIIATIVLIWDIFKWTASGPKIRMNVRSNRRLIGFPGREDEQLIMVEAVNIGDRPTTLTLVGLIHYDGWLDRIRKKPSVQYAVPNPTITQALPYVLEPGKMWTGGITQSEDVEELSSQGHLICQLYDSWHTKPFQKRMKRGGPGNSDSRLSGQAA